MQTYFEDLKKTQRTYSSIVVKHNQLETFRTVISQSSTTRLSELHRSECIMKGSVLFSLLKQQPTLHTLFLSYLKIKKVDKPCEPFEKKFAKLRLNFEDNFSAHWIIEHLHCTEATDLLGLSVHGKNVRHLNWNSFFCRLRGVVENLDLCAINLEHVGDDEALPFDFEWTKLSLSQPQMMNDQCAVLKQLCAASQESSTLKIRPLSGDDDSRAENALRILSACTKATSFEYVGALESENVEMPNFTSFAKFNSIEHLTYRRTCYDKKWDRKATITEFFSLFPNRKHLFTDVELSCS